MTRTPTHAALVTLLRTCSQGVTHDSWGTWWMYTDLNQLADNIIEHIQETE